MLFAANTAVEQIVIAGASRLRFLYCIYMIRMFTNTTRSMEAEQRLCSKAMTSEVCLLQYFRGYKKWIPLSSKFWAINSRSLCSW